LKGFNVVDPVSLTTTKLLGKALDTIFSGTVGKTTAPSSE
jgi:hypothetical protein